MDPDRTVPGDPDDEPSGVAPDPAPSEQGASRAGEIALVPTIAVAVLALVLAGLNVLLVCDLVGVV